YRLANGLRVLLFPDQSKPTVIVNMTYLVGSRFENYGETGMAHLLEHMLFKGTKKIKDVAKEFNSRGMRFNGSTWRDRTNFFELFEASDANLDWALSMEADRMVNSRVAKKDLDTEMTVVRNEYERGENDPENVLEKRFESIAYDWHNYGHDTIGNRSDIENVEIANLQAFYHLYYQPDNAVLLVAGKFDPKKALALINKYEGAIPKPTRKLPHLWTVEPTQDGERSFYVRRVGDYQLVFVGYKLPSALNAETDALGYAFYALADTPSGRLHKALVTTGKAAQVLYDIEPGLDGTLGIIGAVVKKGDPVQPVEDEIIRQMEGFRDNPPTQEEMERARIDFANSADRLLSDPEEIGRELSEYISLGDWRMFFLSRDRTQKMTAQQVRDAAAKYFLRDNRTVGVFEPEENPQRAVMPPVGTAAELLKDYHPQATTSVAEAFDPSPDNIDRRTRHVTVGGMRIALLSKKNRGETAFFDMSLPSGDAKSLFGQRAVGQLAAAMLMRGTTRYNREQLADEFSKLKVSGGVSGRGASFQTTRPNIAAAIRLAAHVLKEPSFPADEFEQLKKQQITSLESQLSDPTRLGVTAMAQHFNTWPKGDPRYSPTLQEQLDDIKAVTLDDVKRYYRTFYGAERAQIAVVGDFDEQEVVKAITDSFSGWKSGTPWTRITDQYHDIAPVSQSIETPDKENAIFLARVNTPVNEDDADYPALYVANYILGGGAGFDSRLTASIRVKDGLSYQVGSQIDVGVFDNDGNWMGYAIAAPQNVARVESTLKEELARFLKDGPTAEELAKAKSGIAQQLAQGRAQDDQLVGELLADIDTGRTFAWDKKFEAGIQALTPAEVLAAARKHIDPAKLSIVKAGDFAKAAAAK
ncbi:MAG TPA: pitrilysin family protein, partial [Steroidobacteraceae bacterium]|nr:pitrilysin family protein [Steroidobacteraceae bacterium]